MPAYFQTGGPLSSGNVSSTVAMSFKATKPVSTICGYINTNSDVDTTSSVEITIYWSSLLAQTWSVPVPMGSLNTNNYVSLVLPVLNAGDQTVSYSVAVSGADGNWNLYLTFDDD